MLIAGSLTLVTAGTAHAGIFERGKVQLICHRTANRDLPENTLESLQLAARMGCNVVEVDIRTTLDGQLVLNHDGMLERLTDGFGDVESSSLDELGLLDAGGFMGERFRGMRIPRLVDALRVARELGIGLELDIKQKGEGAAIYAALRQEGMLERVVFGGDGDSADDLRALYPAGNADLTAWLGPDCTAGEVEAAHAQGRFVVANFSANAHEMDLRAMRTAVARGVDAIAVDYPRLGADAVGRPVEAKLRVLAAAASSGTVQQRTAAIRELSHYGVFPIEPLLVRWLRDPDAGVSRAAAVALVLARPATQARIFLDAVASTNEQARRNAAWALGITHAPVAEALLPLLLHKDPAELREALTAISRCAGAVPAEAIAPLLDHPVPTVRAAAALALARHHPEVAVQAVPALLYREEARSASKYAQARGKARLTQAEIDPIVEDYREHMKLIHALEELPAGEALPLLAKEAFRSAEDYSHVTSVLAGYQLWDRIAADPTLAIAQLGSPDVEVGDRAEWVLVKAGPEVLPAVRAALGGAGAAARERLIRVAAWQGDRESLPLLARLRVSNPAERELIDWAQEKIRELEFRLEPAGSGGGIG